jgi:hypothetical protein
MIKLCVDINAFFVKCYEMATSADEASDTLPDSEDTKPSSGDVLTQENADSSSTGKPKNDVAAQSPGHQSSGKSMCFLCSWLCRKKLFVERISIMVA